MCKYTKCRVQYNWLLYINDLLIHFDLEAAFVVSMTTYEYK